MKRHSKGNWFQTLVIITAIGAILWAGKLFLENIYVPVIIMYHSVANEPEVLDIYSAKLNVLPEAFAKQMKFLHDRNYKVIPLDAFIEKVKRNERIPHKTIAITFDDGLRNNFLNAYPVLKRYNFPATIFMISDFAGKNHFLTWDDMMSIEKNNISIGSHAKSHPWLPGLSPDAIRKELAESKALLEEKTKKKVDVLSYPSGGFNGEVKRLAKASGYIGAVATNPGKNQPKNDPYALKRIRISMTSDNLFVFWLETSGYYTFIKEIRDSE